MERYHRQILQIGEEGQNKLYKAHMAIVGVGAIGSHAAELLVRAGIGRITLIDRDIVEEHNLHRQALFAEQDIGMPKAISAEKKLKGINRGVKITAKAIDLTYKNIEEVNADIILDCTDNLTTRFLLNEYSKKNKKTWIYSSAIGWKGYVKMFSRQECFSCIFDEKAMPGTCDTIGVLNVVPAVIASIQVNEAIKILIGKEHYERLLFFDLEKNMFKQITVQKKLGCRVCEGKYEYLSGEKGTKAAKLCGGDMWQVTREVNFERLKKHPDCFDYGDFVKIEDVTVFSDGRALIKARTEEEARKKYSLIIGD